MARNIGKAHQAQRIDLLRRVLAQAMQTATSPCGAELNKADARARAGQAHHTVRPG